MREMAPARSPLADRHAGTPGHVSVEGRAQREALPPLIGLGVVVDHVAAELIGPRGDEMERDDGGTEIGIPVVSRRAG